MKPQFIEVTQQNIQSAIINAWALYQEPKTRFYPVIDDLQELERIYKEAFMYNHLYILEMDGETAYFPFILDRERRFIQANGGLACSQFFSLFMDAIIKRLEKDYEGYDLVVGYPSSNTAAMSYHQDNVIDDLVEVLIRFEIDLEDTIETPLNQDYGLLKSDQETSFIELHEQFNPEVYWDAPSILEHDDRWILISNQNEGLHSIAGAITYDKDQVRFAEIFFLHSLQDQHSDILISLVQELHQEGIRNILCLVEQEDQILQDSLAQTGFKAVDDYYCYTRVLSAPSHQTND